MRRVIQHSTVANIGGARQCDAFLEDCLRSISFSSGVTNVIGGALKMWHHPKRQHIIIEAYINSSTWTGR